MLSYYFYLYNVTKTMSHMFLKVDEITKARTQKQVDKLPKIWYF